MLFKTVLFLTLLSIFATVLCDDKEVCDFTDEVCVTNAEKPVIKSIIAGNELWELESSDPLHVEKININLSHNMAYIFTDVYLYGMTDCDVRTLRFNNDFSWYFYMIFPQLILKADYIEKGSIDSVPIESQGKIIITYDIYHIVTKGQVETITGSGGKPHINITQYKIDELDVKNGVNFEFINVRTDVLEKSEKAHKYLNDNWKKVNDEIQYQILQPLLDLFFRNINLYLFAVPKYEIFYKNP